MKEKIEMEGLKNQPLFSNFTEQEFLLLTPYLKRTVYPSLEYIFEEGDTNSSDLFFIAKGAVKILKWDPSHHFTYSLGQIEEGNAFGEIAFINQTPRTSTVETVKETILYSLSPQSFFKENKALKDVYRKLLENIAVLSNRRVVETSEKYIHSIRQATEKLARTSESGHSLCEFLSLAFFLNMALYILMSGFLNIDPNTFNFIYWITLGALFFLFKERTILHGDQLGFQSDTFLASLKLASKTLIILLPLLYLLSFIYGVKDTIPMALWTLGLIPYVVIFEVILRGFFLKNLNVFLGENKKYQAIFITAIFSVFLPAFNFQPIPPLLLFMSFVLNLLLTWIYMKAPNLSGVVLVHFAALFFAKWWNIL